MMAVKTSVSILEQMLMTKDEVGHADDAQEHSESSECLR